MVIDVLSKYAWVVPLKDKTGDSLIAAFDHIFKTLGRKPQRLQTDAGTEFLNRKFQAFSRRQGVHHFVTYNQTKVQIAERFNRTLKERMWHYFQHVQKWRYIDVLPKLVWSYNHAVHRSKMCPADVTWENVQQIWHTLYDGMLGQRRQMVPAFQVGDEVRITKAKGTFQKGYEQNWTEEVFKVARVNTVRSPPLYSLVEEDGTSIKGTSYVQELQNVEVRKRDMYRIEKVIRTRGRLSIEQGYSIYLYKDLMKHLYDITNSDAVDGRNLWMPDPQGTTRWYSFINANYGPHQPESNIIDFNIATLDYFVNLHKINCTPDRSLNSLAIVYREEYATNPVKFVEVNVGQNNRGSHYPMYSFLPEMLAIPEVGPYTALEILQAIDTLLNYPTVKTALKNLRGKVIVRYDKMSITFTPMMCLILSKKLVKILGINPSEYVEIKQVDLPEYDFTQGAMNFNHGRNFWNNNDYVRVPKSPAYTLDANSRRKKEVHRYHRLAYNVSGKWGGQALLQLVPVQCQPTHQHITQGHQRCQHRLGEHRLRGRSHGGKHDL